LRCLSVVSFDLWYSGCDVCIGSVVCLLCRSICGVAVEMSVLRALSVCCVSNRLAALED
jgi:hypothetical protein